MDCRVSVERVSSYAGGELDRAVERHFDALELGEAVRPGMRVTLKPNLLMKRAPEACTTTHPALVKAVIRRLRKMGVEDITVADSPGGPYTKSALEGIYAASGMKRAAEETGVKLNLDIGCCTAALPWEGSLLQSVSLIGPVAGADLVINLPKLKTHAMTMLSGGIKNLLGCVPGLQKPELHFRFPQRERFGRMLAELARLVAPAVTIVDAVEAMEGDGPSGGEARHVGLTLAARHVFSLDVALCHLIGLEPAEVPMVRYSQDTGLAPGTGELLWLGEGTPAAIVDFRKPASQNSLDFTGRLPRLLQGPVQALERRFLAPVPQISRSRCVGCGKCAESCAPEAVTIQTGKAVIRYDRCIRCFCCHEMCPVKAVGIRQFRLLQRL